VQRAASEMCKRPRHENNNIGTADRKLKEDKPWWDHECQHLQRTKYILLNQFRRSRRDDDLKLYHTAKKNFRNKCKQKERHYKNTLLTKLKDSVDNLNFWTLVKEWTSSKHSKQSRNISCEQWLTHFSDLYNNNDLENVTEFGRHVNNSNILHNDFCVICDNDQPDLLNFDITQDEILSVVNKLRNGKSPGPDGIMYEMYTNSIDILIEPICKLLNLILTSGIYPDKWSCAIISPLFKKGSRSDPKNYRGISLLCCISKIFTKIINNRLVYWSDLHSKLDEGQAAYRVGRSTVDHIFTLYAMAQKYLSKRGGRFYCMFIDFSRAFDSIPHAHLWYRLIDNGIHGKFLTLL